jgi:bacillithiol synthase
VQESTVPAANRAAIDVRRFPWIRRFAADYAFAFERLAPFFAGNPSDPAAWRRAIAGAQQHPRQRDRLAEILLAQHQAFEAPAAVRANIDRLRDPRAVAIVTGQQAGLFGGPLFTLLKALTAIRLAGQVERDHGVPAVPVFWIDAEDHDWDEVKTVGVLDRDLDARTIALPDPPGAGDVPVARIRLDAGIAHAVGALRELLPPTEFTNALVDGLARAYAPGVGMSEAFGRWLAATLGSRGLVLFCSADREAKTLVSSVFAEELSRPGHTAALAAAAGARLQAAGYHAQVEPHEGAVALFHLDGSRQVIRHEQGRFLIGERHVEATDVLRMAEREPQAFSPNVLLRPIVQDTLFPTACYVAGPNELAYLGQLREVYARFGVPMPLMASRASVTLLDAGAARFLRKYALPLEALQPRDEAGLNRLLEAQLPPTVEAACHDATLAVGERMAAVIAAVPAIDPTLAGAARSTLGRMERELRTLHGKIIQAAKRRDETLRRQFTRARAQAFPHGHPQERELGSLVFLNRYGPALVDVLAEDLPIEEGQHWVLTL